MQDQEIKNVNYKTKELSFLEKFLQAYWFNPKSWLLDEFRFENDILFIKCRNGNTMEAPLSEIDASYAVDNYDRHEFYLKHNGKKLHFKEIPWMLEDDEWEMIKSILKPYLNGIGKLNNSLRKIQKEIRGIKK